MYSILSRGPVPVVPANAFIWTEEAVEERTQSEPKTLTVAEAAAAIGVGLTTVKKLISTKELPSLVVRRRRMVRREAIDLFLERRESGKARGR